VFDTTRFSTQSLISAPQSRPLVRDRGTVEEGFDTATDASYIPSYLKVFLLSIQAIIEESIT
jgi:hypothetical protein